ncbi:hypothetical protein V2W30_41365 (plasmid) [Streptomyces sp. Q6]|uniref:Uncharacterized protein n=1 Tax=Streptomyces citrinus TaxID=3118173 RepID=A0ACD5AW84_9ACTN
MKITQYVPLTGVTVRQLVAADHFSVPLPTGTSGATRSPWLHVTAVTPNRVLPGYATVATAEGEITLPYTEPVTPHSMSRTLPLTCANCRTLRWVHLNLAHRGVPVEAVCHECEDAHPPTDSGPAGPDSAAPSRPSEPSATGPVDDAGTCPRIPRPRTTGDTP